METFITLAYFQCNPGSLPCFFHVGTICETTDLATPWRIQTEPHTGHSIA